MPQYVAWDPAVGVGPDLLDAQHEALLALCNRLADSCAGRGGAADDAAFDQVFLRLKALAQEHFETETALSTGRPDGDSEFDPDEREQFEYLLGEIATPANFSRLELQRFLALWWLGHIRGMAAGWAANGA